MAWMSTRFKLSNLIFLLSFSSAIGMVIFAYAPNQLSLLMALILIIGILQQGGFTGLYGVASKVYPTEIRSTGIGWAIGLGRSGAVAGPAIAGYLIVAGFDMQGPVSLALQTLHGPGACVHTRRTTKPLSS